MAAMRVTRISAEVFTDTTATYTNCKRVSRGDIVILRDSLHGYGAAKVEEIRTHLGVKLVRRCPVCQKTGIKTRTRRSPPWRCAQGHEFELTIEREEPVTNYEAHFPNTFLTLSNPISVTDIKAAAPRPSDQLSIEELNFARLEQPLAGDQGMTTPDPRSCGRRRFERG